MQLYDDPTTVEAQPAAPAAGPSGPGWFTDGLPGGQVRTIIRAWWLNLIQAELVAIVVAAGLTASRTVQNQLLQAVRILSQGLQVWAVDASSTVNLVEVVLVQMPASLVNGQAATVKLATTNTGAATLTFGGFGNAPIERFGVGLQAGDLQAGMLVKFVYHDGVWDLVTAQPRALTLAAVDTLAIAADTSPTAGTIVCTPTPAPAALTNGMTIRVKIANTVMGASNLSLGGTGNYPIKLAGRDTLAGDIVSGAIVVFTWDAVGEVWAMTSASCRYRQSGVVASGGANGDYELTFPAPFANACLFIAVTPAVASPTYVDAVTLAGLPGPAGVTVHRKNSTTGDTSVGFMWEAEGY